MFLIGSKDVCQLRSKLPGIAEEHCALVTRDRKVFIRDLDSGQPTRLNGAIIPPGQEWPLHAGDRLAVGPMEFVVQFHEKELSKDCTKHFSAAGARVAILCEPDFAKFCPDAGVKGTLGKCVNANLAKFTAKCRNKDGG